MPHRDRVTPLLPDRGRMTRRQLMTRGGIALLGLAGGGTGARLVTAGRDTASPAGPEPGRGGPATEPVAGPPSTARVVILEAAETELDLGGRVVRTWAYGGQLPGPPLRATAGEVLEVRLRNWLPAPTTIHWHGIATPWDQDGVPDLPAPAIGPGRSGGYRFAPPDPGTYWYHPHVGVQLDRGLHGVVIVDDPREPGAYDLELVVVLDDWLDGTGRTPDQVLRTLSGGMAAMGSGGSMGAAGAASPGAGQPGGGMAAMPELRSALLGGDAGDVAYPHYLVNGRTPRAPATLRARPGQRARIRLVNAAADTAFRVALGGHRLTVTHSDGFPVDPVTVDSLLLAMGERYDLAVTLGDGAFPLVAVAEGKGGQGMAIVRTAAGAAPPARARPAELRRRLLRLQDLRASEGVSLSERRPDRSHDLVLEGDMMRWRWTINGRGGGEMAELPVSTGERVRLRFVNLSSMFHPMHLHGHTFQVRHGELPGPRKDTVVVLPLETVVADLVAGNPGRWLAHCHNLYHSESGMMAVLDYVS
jgi:FtsP/CotA-like multicopper oxidase with cupredoxin domain